MRVQSYLPWISRAKRHASVMALLAALFMGLVPAQGPGARAELLPANIDVVETITVDDGPIVVPPAVITIDESISAVESPAVAPPAVIEVDEAITLVDTPAATPPAVIDIGESIAIGDSPAVLPPANIVVDESVSVSDTTIMPAIITVVETVSVTDSPAVTPPAVMLVDENISVLDSPDVLAPNVTPEVTAGASLTINEGGALARSGSFTDPDLGPWTATVNYGAGSGNLPLALNPDQTFALSHIYNDNGNFLVSVTVEDATGASGSNSFTVVAANLPPAAIFAATSPVEQGNSSVLSLSGASDPGSSDTATGFRYSFACDSLDTSLASTYSAASAAAAAGCPFTETGVFTVKGRVLDKDNGHSTYQATVQVSNASPIVTPPAAQTADESTSRSFTLGSFTDPGASDGPWNVVVDWGDGTAHTILSMAAPGAIPPQSHTYTEGPISHTVLVSVTDKNGGVGAGIFNVTVGNADPANIVISQTAGSISENGTVTLSGSFSDKGVSDTHTAIINWGDGSPNTTLALAAGLYSFSGASHQYLDDNPTATPSDVYQVAVTVTDDDGGTAGASTAITIDNASPTITGASGSPPLAQGSQASVTASFTDAGPADTHTCTFLWDDGQTSTMTAPGTGNGSCTGTHTYEAAGVYTVRIAVTDDDGGVSPDYYYEYVVVYDPGAGFVTGSGWINSPAGAYTADPALTGRANFGFVSKYQKGATIPGGDTQFQFHAAGFKFISTAYQWLVVSGARAQYKGTGTVNGVPGYSFLLTATDGQQTGGGGDDKFRIKITKDGVVVYDNVPAATSDDIDKFDPQVIGAGSIVVHTKK